MNFNISEFVTIYVYFSINLIKNIIIAEKNTKVYINSLPLGFNRIKNIKYSIRHSIAYKFRYYKYLYVVRLIISSAGAILLESHHYGIIKTLFNDPDIHYQWYYVKKNILNLHLSHELDKLWYKNIKGKDINIGIIGGAIQINHKDLKDNLLENSSYNFVENSQELYFCEHNDATITAGLISAVSNNSLCGVGAAPSSKFSSLQIFYHDKYDLDDYRISRAVLWRINILHIYVFDWNLPSVLSISEFPGKNTITSLNIGNQYGRYGLGSIYLAGTGNYGREGNNCAFDGFLQKTEILVFSGISSNGSILPQFEKCNSILAASLGSEKNSLNYIIYSTLLSDKCENSIVKNITPATISAGIIALMLSANPLLTVRELIYHIVITSIQYDTYSICNAAGLYYSSSFGYGMLNAEKLVQSANVQDGNFLAEENTCSTKIFIGNYLITKQYPRSFYIYSSGCLDAPFCVTLIEQIIISFTIITHDRSYINIFLTSPSGTRYKIIESRPFDHSRNGFRNWKLKLMGFYGEKILGIWKLEILNIKTTSRLRKLEFTFYGTCVDSRINVISHTRIKNYISSKGNQINYLSLLIPVFNTPIEFDHMKQKDILSFLGSDRSIFEILNDIKENIN